MKKAWRKFAEAVAVGESQRAAYEMAGYKARGEGAKEGGARLMRQPGMREYIDKLRQSAVVSMGPKARLKLVEKLDFLADIVLTGPGEVEMGNRLCQTYKRFANGTVEVKLPCKLRALELHAKYSGESSEYGRIEPRDEMARLLHAIRNAEDAPSAG